MESITLGIKKTGDGRQGGIQGHRHHGTGRLKMASNVQTVKASLVLLGLSDDSAHLNSRLISKCPQTEVVFYVYVFILLKNMSIKMTAIVFEKFVKQMCLIAQSKKVILKLI